jgi:steroid 5-alpha reductase family enzyme
MRELLILRLIIITWFALAAVVFIALFFFVAPYGRHVRKGWGPGINNRLGWVIMEVPAALVFAVCFILGINTVTVTAIVFMALWEIHYVHRAFIYPFTTRGEAKRMTVTVVVFGFVFNVVNAYLNGRYIFTYSHGYGNEWLLDVRFVVGVLLFVLGFIMNRQADNTLRRLRQPGESGYKIPYGDFYRWISCPNYFGEILIWVGWAVATWSLAGLAFAVWTTANLAPRARSNHAWYRKQFADYPASRKALIPKLW